MSKKPQRKFKRAAKIILMILTALFIAGLIQMMPHQTMGHRLLQIIIGQLSGAVILFLVIFLEAKNRF